MQDGELEFDMDLDDIKPSALKRLLREALTKKGKDRHKEQAAKQQEKDSEDRVDLREEKNGKSPSVPVTREDIPKSIRDADEEDNKEEDKNKDDEKDDKEEEKE